MAYAKAGSSAPAAKTNSKQPTSGGAKVVKASSSTIKPSPKGSAAFNVDAWGIKRQVPDGFLGTSHEASKQKKGGGEQAGWRI